MSYFTKDDGGIEWIKVIIPLLALWMAWVTYNGYTTRRLLNLETRLDNKFSDLSGNLWRKTAADNLRHEERIDKLYLLIAGGHDGKEESDLDNRERARSGSSSDSGERVGN